MNLFSVKNNFQESEAQEQQIQILKQKTGEERLKLGLQLRDLAVKLAQAGIRDAHPCLSAKEMQIKLWQRIYGDDFCAKISDQKIRNF